MIGIGSVATLCLALQLAVFVHGSDVLTNGPFTADLFTTIVEGKENDNIVMSPMSIQTCMAMAFMGAEGKTAEEMVTGLHLGTSNKQEVSKQFEKVLSYTEKSSAINIANKIFLNKGSEIKPEYNERVKRAFFSEAEVLDFSEKDKSTKTINGWVESKTNNLIKNLVSPAVLGADITMLLVNAIHFKSNWVNPFGKSNFKDDFWMNKVDKTSVDMMRKTEFFKYAEFPELDATAVELPYEETDFSMMLLLPNQHDGLKALESKLKTNDFLKLSSQLKTEYVFITMPKFKTEFSINLNSAMKKLGMVTMYSDAADFSSLLKTAPVQVSDVVHKAIITVDEDGTEAAAATFLRPVPISAIVGPPPKDFKVDHPFVFLIKDNSAVYFVGHIAKF